MKAGDNVYILPGTYAITEAQIAKEENPYKIVFNMNHAGTTGKPISFIGLTEDGKRPVFDLSQVNPTGFRVTAFYVTGSYLIFRNFEVVGVQVNITDHTQSENFRISRGRDCTFDHIACHDGMGIGFYLENGYSAPLEAGGKPVSRGDGNGMKIGGYRLDRKDVKQYDRGYPCHTISNCIAYGTNRSLQWVNGDVDSCTVNNNSFTWNKETRYWDNNGLKKDLFDSIDPEVLLGARDKNGMLTNEATAFMRLKRYEGRGADFPNYPAFVADMKRKVGAER